MKRIILLALIAIVSISAFARKSYITVYVNADPHSLSCLMTGDVPNGIEHFSYNADKHYYYCYYYSYGEILNILSEYGYEVEKMTDYAPDNRILLILSKETSSSQTEIVGDINNDSEVNVADINQLVNIILGLVKANPGLLEQVR